MIEPAAFQHQVLCGTRWKIYRLAKMGKRKQKTVGNDNEKVQCISIVVLSHNGAVGPHWGEMLREKSIVVKCWKRKLNSPCSHWNIFCLFFQKKNIVTVALANVVVVVKKPKAFSSDQYRAHQRLEGLITTDRLESRDPRLGTRNRRLAKENTW